MEAKEVCEILDLAVDKWHEVADEHNIKHCNCFRVEFGEALIAKYGISTEQMREAWKDYRVYIES